MDNIQMETIKKEKPDNIFIILALLIINASIIWNDEIGNILTNHLDVAVIWISLIILVFLDSRHLTKLGYPPTISGSWVIIFGGFFLIVWIWKRYTWIGDKVRLLFWVLLLSTGASFYYAYHSESAKIISETACNLTNQIMSEQYKLPDLKCSRVVDIKEIDKDFYKAKAIFNNGTTQSITIDVREENGQQMVYVSLNPLGN